MAGRPCKLFTPHVSWIRSHDIIIGWIGGLFVVTVNETLNQNNGMQTVNKKSKNREFQLWFGKYARIEYIIFDDNFI